MTEAAQIRARLDALAAEEAVVPSRVWAPVDHPGPCRPPFLVRIRDCDCSRCCATAPHDPGCSQPDSPECTCPPDADYHQSDCPEYEGADMPTEFTADEISRCHEATEFDHECVVCRAVGQETERPDEAIPGVDF